MSRKISSAGIERLALYYRYLTSLRGSGRAFTSSEELGKAVGHTAAQVRRDLSCFGTFGIPGKGYPTAELEVRLSEILGKETFRNVVLVGVGNLGSALLAHKGFRSQHYTIAAAFDNDLRKIGKHLEGLEIRDTRDMANWIPQTGAEIGMVSVPGDAAQEVVDALVSAGIKGILNFAPARVTVPEGIILQHVDLSIELDRLCYLLEHPRR